MKNIENMQDTFKEFKKTIGKIQKATSSPEIAELELECVRKLQLAEVQIAMCGYDLKEIVMARRRELVESKAQPEPEPEPKSEAEVEVETKPKTETKTSHKK